MLTPKNCVVVDSDVKCAIQPTFVDASGGWHCVTYNWHLVNDVYAFDLLHFVWCSHLQRGIQSVGKHYILAAANVNCSKLTMLVVRCNSL